MLTHARLQEIMATKTNGVPNESWSAIDNTLVIFDLDNPPAWLVPVLAERDEDGNTVWSDEGRFGLSDSITA